MHGQMYKMGICWLGFFYGSCTMVLHHIFLQFRNSWTACFQNSGYDRVDTQHGLLVPLIQSIIFLSVRTSKFCLWHRSQRRPLLSPGTSKFCLCYRNQRRPGLAATNTEWILDDSYTWHFPVSQAITLETCSVLRWSSRWTLRAFFYNRRP
jgi:hypothetical protein